MFATVTLDYHYRRIVKCHLFEMSLPRNEYSLYCCTHDDKVKLYKSIHSELLSEFCHGRISAFE